MIDLTPLEVRKKKGDFRRAMRGYDPALVDDFLDLVADRLEELVRENLSLHERVTRQDEQVKDHRDRERALTEALVSAQEMREEVRRQAVREAELSKSAAEQHASKLRADVDAEVRQLRSAAKEEAQKLLGSLQSERQREEETLRHLRARQQEFFNTYRSFLEEELAELAVISRAGAARPVMRAGESAPSARRTTQPASDKARTKAPVARNAEAPSTREEIAEDMLDEHTVSEEAAYVIGATPAEVAAIVEIEAEPFEPEAFLDEESAAVAEAFRAEQDAGADAGEPADRTEVSDAGAEMRLYDTIAPDEDGDGVPGPIGLGAPAAAGWDSEPTWSIPDLDVVGDVADSADLDLDLDDEDDPDTLLLLRNAAAAGYILADDDEPPAELLLDEAVVDEDETVTPANPEDDGWLPTLLEDDK